MSRDPLEFRPKTPTEQRLELLHGIPADTLIRDLYDREQLTQQQIADRLGISRDTVLELMRRHGIATRDRRAVVTA